GEFAGGRDGERSAVRVGYASTSVPRPDCGSAVRAEGRLRGGVGAEPGWHRPGDDAVGIRGTRGRQAQAGTREEARYREPAVRPGFSLGGAARPGKAGGLCERGQATSGRSVGREWRQPGGG